jgi:alpha,alpha-trehalase
MLARLALTCLLPLLAAAGDSPPPRPPAELYPGLLEQVQMQRVFEDGKTFVDAAPRKPPEEIVEDYRAMRDQPGFDLRGFVLERFTPPSPAESGFEADPGREIAGHIDALWNVLARDPEAAAPGSSLIPLPRRYVVPGGRFREIYYWDSYFTMIGLAESGRDDLVKDMLRNFASLIDRFGHIPNGNRSYYLSRSQPPFFALMVELVAAREGGRVYREFLPQMRREYEFWMDGSEALAAGGAHRRVVRLQDGSLLNRYWDDRDIPREESWREDVETARASGRPVSEVYRNLRAAAESGWDFSSRWLADGRSLESITSIASSLPRRRRSHGPITSMRSPPRRRGSRSARPPAGAPSRVTCGIRARESSRTMRGAMDGARVD